MTSVRRKRRAQRTRVGRVTVYRATARTEGRVPGWVVTPQVALAAVLAVLKALSRHWNLLARLLLFVTSFAALVAGWLKQGCDMAGNETDLNRQC